MMIMALENILDDPVLAIARPTMKTTDLAEPISNREIEARKTFLGL